MEMTRECLEDYRSKKAEIQELRYKLDHLGEGDEMMGHSTILNGKYYPPKPEPVVGPDWKKYDRLKKKYSDRLAELEKDCAEVELWIEEIPDSLTRRIFRMTFIDGLSQREIAKRVHMHQSNVSRKIDGYLKLHQMHQKM